MEYALKLEDVTKKYDGFTLDRMTFSLPQGCIMGLVGENGAGKTTVIKLIMDLIGRDGGTIEVLGGDSRALTRENKERIGVVMDESCFPEGMTLGDANKVMGRIYRSWDEGEFRRLCEIFSLPQKKAVKAYSRGMKMKLAIAAALSHSPDLLILDEATSGLDPVVREEILDVFWDFVQNENHSILISSHIISDLEKICDYVAMIHKGKLLFCREKDDLLQSYGLFKGSQSELSQIDPGAVVGWRKNSFGVEALVEKDAVCGGTFDRATMEDIMLFFIRGEKI
jgi:ABC-2 type transport system ATP-binding protein